jgi:hypothetical protein
MYIYLPFKLPSHCNNGEERNKMSIFRKYLCVIKIHMHHTDFEKHTGLKKLCKLHEPTEAGQCGDI